MITENGLILDTTYEQVLEDLKAELEQNDIWLFPHIKPLANSIQFSCPFHGTGREKHPSCGITKYDVKKSDRIVPAGTAHCFTCNYVGGLSEFISNVFGFMDGGRYGNNWLKSHYTTSKEVVRETVRLDIKRGSSEPTRPVVPYIKESVLDSYRYIHPYMYTRGLTLELIEEYDIGYDKDTNCITMPLRDLTGGTVFVNRRSVASKFHHFEEFDPKTEYVYGMFELQQNNVAYDEPIYVTESILNALTWRKLGKWAVAFMGVGGGKQYDILKMSPYRHFVASFDPDAAGDKATARLNERLCHFKTVESVQYTNECYNKGWDINDLQEDALTLPVTIIQ